MKQTRPSKTGENRSALGRDQLTMNGQGAQGGFAAAISGFQRADAYEWITALS